MYSSAMGANMAHAKNAVKNEELENKAFIDWLFSSNETKDENMDTIVCIITLKDIP